MNCIRVGAVQTRLEEEDLKMRRILLAGLLLAGIGAARPAMAQDSVKIFVGYSFASVPFTIENPGQILIVPTKTFICLEACQVPGPTFSQMAANSSGWEISSTVKVHKWLGIAADFDGHYSGSGSTAIHRYSFLFGPEVALPGRVSPFVHVLAGTVNESTGTGSTGSAFATAAGGGIDIKAGHLLSIRLIQADYLMSRFGGFSQNKYRISAGIVLRF
jgi:hypothetical protein